MKPVRWSDLPLFSDDRLLGAALLGPKRACEWAAMAALYEGHGMPKIDAIMGGRYVPAVKAFFDRQYLLTERAPAAPDGPENLAAWNAPKTARRHQA